MNGTFRRTLRVKMFIVVVLGLLLSIVIYFGGIFALNKYVTDVYMSPEHTSRRAAREIQSFASYVTSHSIKGTDTRALRAWQEQRSDVYILIYNNDDIVFDSDWVIQKKGAYKYIITNSDTGEVIILIQDSYGTIRKIRKTGRIGNKKSDSSETAGDETLYDASTESAVEIPGDSSAVRSLEFDYNFYPVLFKDGVFDVCIVDYSDDTLKEVGKIVMFVLCCAIFIAIIIYYFGRDRQDEETDKRGHGYKRR